MNTSTIITAVAHAAEVGVLAALTWVGLHATGIDPVYGPFIALVAKKAVDILTPYVQTFAGKGPRP